MIGLAWLWKGEPPREPSASSVPGPARVFPAQWGAFAWLIVIFAGTEIWYRSHERQLIERPRWQVAWPVSNDAVKTLPIPDSTRVILHYDEAKTATWEEPRGVSWWTFFAYWKPERAALQLVRSHSPEICLPAIGRNFRSARADVKVKADPISLVFRSYEFEQNGRPRHLKINALIHELQKMDMAADVVGKLVCPIGLTAIRDKAPAAIAASVAAQVLMVREAVLGAVQSDTETRPGRARHG